VAADGHAVSLKQPAADAFTRIRRQFHDHAKNQTSTAGQLNRHS